jgi:hypothetical protein
MCLDVYPNNTENHFQSSHKNRSMEHSLFSSIAIKEILKRSLKLKKKGAESEIYVGRCRLISLSLLL